MSNEVKVEMKKSKETKGTYVYANPEAVVTSVYIKKEAFPNGAPNELVMTLTPKD